MYICITDVNKTCIQRILCSIHAFCIQFLTLILRAFLRKLNTRWILLCTLHLTFRLELSVPLAFHHHCRTLHVTGGRIVMPIDTRPALPDVEPAIQVGETTVFEPPARFPEFSTVTTPPAVLVGVVGTEHVSITLLHGVIPCTMI